MDIVERRDAALIHDWPVKFIEYNSCMNESKYAITYPDGSVKERWAWEQKEAMLHLAKLEWIVYGK